MRNLTKLLKQAAADKYIQGNFNERWEILEPLGSFSKVSIAMRKNSASSNTTQNNDTEFAAVKTIDKKTIYEGYDSEVLLAREVKALRLAGNGNNFVVDLYEVIEEKDKVYIVQELLRGGELFQRIVNCGFFDEIHASRLAYSMVASIAHCHSVHVVHRDLKPENFVFENEQENCKLKLVDFGLANIMASENVAFYTLCGSPSYIAPEILFQQAYTSKVDVWSLGIIIHILLSGHAPFEHRDEKVLFHKIKYDQVEFRGGSWTDISDEAKDLVLKMLTKTPQSRPDIYWCLQHPWILKGQRCYENAVVSPSLKNTLRNLRNFDAREKWEEAISKIRKANRLAHLAELHERILSATMEPDESHGPKFDVSEVEERSMTLFEETREEYMTGEDLNEEEQEEEIIGKPSNELNQAETASRFEHFLGRKPPSKEKESQKVKYQDTSVSCGLCVLQ
ncbi:Calcium/calmodulin-dependent protein kinase type 1 [Galdieria sulphuraria]|nr:Calcium/calmodulin-dependent protein kinase type 1 [Galdieria sulphuraria]